MPEIPNVVAGEPVEADWGNDIRDRVAQRFADATARTASLPFPAAGALSWLNDPGQLDYFDGAVWITLADVPALDTGLALKVAKAGDTMTGGLIITDPVGYTGALASPTAAFSSSFDLAGITSWQDAFAVPVTVDGQYLFRFTTQADITAQGAADQFSIGMGIAAGASSPSWSRTIITGKSGVALPAKYQLSCSDIQAVTAGQTLYGKVQKASPSLTVVARQMWLEAWPLSTAIGLQI